jgi:glycosyltransferase involved in cell wall biosynthesis
MTATLILSGILLVIAWLWLRFAKREVSLPVWSTLEIPALAENESPLVSVIVCARNQPQDAVRCVQSLLRQDYPRFEVIAVDAHSSDGTRERLLEMEARADGVLCVLHGEAPPRGWLGRPFALHQGMAMARGEWLLFTTAESYHAPELLSRAMAYARLQGLGLLSLAPRQECRTFWAHVWQPVALQYLNFIMPMEQVGEANARGVWASEEFLLVSRTAHRAAGGHAAVALKPHEGGLLMRRVKSLGYRVEFIKAMDLLQVRAYHTLYELWEGWSKSLYCQFGAHPLLAAAYVMGILAWAVLPFAALLPAFSFGFWGLDAVQGWWDVVLAACAILAGVTILQAESVVRRVHRQNHFYTATLPLGGICVAAAGLNGFVRKMLRKEGSIEGTWWSDTIGSGKY